MSRTSGADVRGLLLLVVEVARAYLARPLYAPQKMKGFFVGTVDTRGNPGGISGDDEMRDDRACEPFACDGGCFGGV